MAIANAGQTFDLGSAGTTAIDTILTQEANRIGSDIHRRTIHVSPWMDLIKQTASTVDAWVKISNHATTAAAQGEVTVFLVGTGGGGQTHCITFNDGLKLSTGATTASHTAVDGTR